jgi:hypothetical protein
MANAVITLAAAGTDTGPFDLYSNADSYAVAFETGVSKSSLLAGYYTFVPNAATVVRVKSASALCTNFVDMEITSTTTTTTTTQPQYFYYTADYCTGGSAGTVRVTVDQVLNSVFDLGNYVCVTLTGFTFGPAYNIDLGDGETYLGTNCSACPTPPPGPTYVPIPSYAYLYNTSNAPNTGVCCQGSYLYVNGSGDFVTTPTAGYTFVEYFYVDDNGGNYFDTATVMYADDLLTFPVPAGYYGSQPIGYRQIVGIAGQFLTSITSCAGVDCP